MREPFPKILRDRIPALLATALLHAAVIAALLTATQSRQASEIQPPETVIAYLPEPVPPATPRVVRRPHVAHGSNAITQTLPDYVLPPEWRRQMDGQGLQLALASCAPENLDMQSREIRDVCGRIGALIANDPTIVAGPETGIKNTTRWQHELLVKQTPLLLPCMTPGGPDVLYLLVCVYDVVMHGYKEEKMAHYSK